VEWFGDRGRPRNISGLIAQARSANEFAFQFNPVHAVKSMKISGAGAGVGALVGFFGRGAVVLLNFYSAAHSLPVVSPGFPADGRAFP
jgi:hypothetical protein